MDNNKKRYKITWGNGTYQLSEAIIDVEDYECEQDALDHLIDRLELDGDTYNFLQESDLAENGGPYWPDEYIIGGNSGRILHHHGTFNIILCETEEKNDSK